MNYQLTNEFKLVKPERINGVLFTSITIWRVRVLQFVTVIPEKIPESYLNPIGFISNGVLSIQTFAGWKLDSADAPGAQAFIAMELNNHFWIITDLEHWQQYRRIDDGPLSDGSGGRLLLPNAVILNQFDLEKIKTALAEWCQ